MSVYSLCTFILFEAFKYVILKQYLLNQYSVFHYYINIDMTQSIPRLLLWYMFI